MLASTDTLHRYSVAAETLGDDPAVIGEPMWNSWFALSFQAAQLGWEAQSVIALRLMRLATGGALARSEARLMVTEKVLALAEAQSATAAIAIKGGNGRDAARKILRVYKKRVRGNKRRLSK
jgi:hypothetical protein